MESNNKEALRTLFTSYNYNGNYQELIEARETLEKELDRLEEYRKIEEEIGIDLITLFKAYSNGFYVKGEKEKQYIDFQNALNANAFKNKEMFYGHEWHYQYVKLYDYGVTWSLTKEDLEQ